MRAGWPTHEQLAGSIPVFPIGSFKNQGFSALAQKGDCSRVMPVHALNREGILLGLSSATIKRLLSEQVFDPYWFWVKNQPCISGLGRQSAVNCDTQQYSPDFTGQP